MKRSLFLLFSVMLATAAVADGGLKQYSKVVLTLLDGRIFDIDINADSYIYSYTKGEDIGAVQYVEVHGTREMYLFGRDELLSIKFIDDAIVNDDIVTDENNPMRYINGELLFHGSLSGESIQVYDVAGKKVLDSVVLPGRKISLDKFARGTYLVEVKGFKTKVMVR